MIRSLKVRGSFLGSTGYDHHVREVVRGLSRAGVRVELSDTIERQAAALQPVNRDPWFDSLRAAPAARSALHILMPQEARPLPGLRNVLYTMFEAIPAHPSWVAMSGAFDLLLVPTESSRQAWMAGGMPRERIRLCPLGVDSALYGGPVVPLPLRRDNGVPVVEYRTRFLNVAAIGPRKNLAGLLRAWLRATTSKDDAVLVLKIGLFYPGDETLLHQYVSEAEQAAGRRLIDAAPVHALFDVLPEAAMPRLYAAATHYISLSHGEGWDLPMLEAGASGLKLIAPWHSAYTAYLDERTAHFIPSVPVPTAFQGSPYLTHLFAGAFWWDPDETVAAALIRAAIHGTATPKASPRDRILRELSWDRCVSRLLMILDQLERGSGTALPLWNYSR